ncbi:multidrug efflux SMR transporter [Microcystis flos-aquae FACHB-1344]|uniref:Multidrug efflux SMR transporter n=1 Tax=Microcystis flos-aquae FACHB-1344 TaxID=2692899 RepID=A0ABR8HSY9_9CHRO|nr:multidrug efflux SMR transporter [Microcystis flos-aquae FACHB-1344]MCA2699194.1 multidrug efflux SMR transporter [Microcystis sp. M179S2]
MSWYYLIIAILFETAGTTCMKLSNGFTNLLPSALILVCYVASLSIFTVALRGINLNIAYAVWSGLGTALVAVLGFLIFKENLSPLKIVSIIWIIIGVVGLNLNMKLH